VTLKTELQPTSDCLAIDRFGETLNDAEKAHVQACPRCEAEFVLWQEFTDSKPTPAEGAAVQWITSELHRRTAAPRVPLPATGTGWFSSLQMRSVMGLAAAAVLAVGVVGYIAWDPEPRVGLPAPGEQIYRTASLDVIAPTGDVPKAPTELVWMTFDGAVRYDVQVLEIDRTVLWRTTSLAPPVRLPGSVVEQIVPGKTLLWDVTAIDGSGTSIATSGPQRFRVSITIPPGRQ
jgi:hypothetical protein